MNKKILLTSGCSFSTGFGIPNIIHPMSDEDWKQRCESRWSYFLSQELNLTEENIGSDGSSNNSILRSIIEWISNNKSSLDDIVLVVGWTTPGRKEFFNSLFNQYESVGFSYLPTDDNWPTSKWWETYISYFYNDIEQVDSLVLNMIALQNICQSNKIPYYFFNSFWSFVDNENKVGGFTWDEFLDKHKYSNLLDITKIDKVCQLKYIEDNYGDFVIDGHPGIKSNKMWAEYLEKQIRSLYE